MSHPKFAYFEGLFNDSPIERKHKIMANNNVVKFNQNSVRPSKKINERKHQKKKSHSFDNKNRYLEILKQIRTLNDYQKIPSIPGEKNRLGYYETFGKKLFLPKFEECEISPVSYQNLSDSNKLPHNIVAFKSKLKRFAQSKSPTDANLGPGSYEVFSKKPFTPYVKKTFFLSETKRESSPGPGSYLNEANITTFTRKQSPTKKFQFFQSGAERFHKLPQKVKVIPLEIGVNLFTGNFQNNYKDFSKNENSDFQRSTGLRKNIKENKNEDQKLRNLFEILRMKNYE